MLDATPPAKQPLITIGLPLYNAEVYLDECLAGLLRQTMVDFEIIVSDNASTDCTRDTVRKYMSTDSRIRLIEHPENYGALKNYQSVLDVAQGEFFLWRAHDDWSDDNYLEVLTGALQEHPDKSFAVPKLVYVDSDDKTVCTHAFASMPSHPRWKRIKMLLMQERAPWVYGLYRTKSLLPAFAETKAYFPYVWGWDHIVMLPFLLNDVVVGTNDTSFFIRVTDLSARRYKPSSIAERWTLHKAFLRECLRVLNTIQLTWSERIVLMVALYRFTQGKADKLHRIVRHAIIDTAKRIIR